MEDWNNYSSIVILGYICKIWLAILGTLKLYHNLKGLNRERLSFLSEHRQTSVLVRPKVMTNWILYSLLSFHPMITWPQTRQTKCVGLSLQPVAVLQGIAKFSPE